MLLACGALLLCVLINLVMYASAVEGWQDEKGFHFGSPTNEVAESDQVRSRGRSPASRRCARPDSIRIERTL